jgi:hypothetical protein
MQALVEDFETKTQRRTDVAPHWCHVEDAGAPHERVDEGEEAGQASPDHEETRPRVPRLEMPGKWEEDEDEAKERKDGEGGVSGVDAEGVSHWEYCGEKMDVRVQGEKEEPLDNPSRLCFVYWWPPTM